MIPFARILGSRAHGFRMLVFGASRAGAVPAASAFPSASKVLAEDGTWVSLSGGGVPTSRTVNGHALSSDVTLTASDVGADASGAASSAVSTHVGLSDPHTQYALESALGGAAALNVGTTAGTVAAGDDSRLSNARTPANLSATARLWGRNSSGAGAAEEVTGSQVLDWLSSTAGALLTRGASTWSAIALGVAGQVLRAGGSAPGWADAGGDFGSGYDGAIDFDGTTTIVLDDRSGNGTTVSLVPSGGVYTLVQDLEATTIRTRSGVRVNTGGFVARCTGLHTFDDATSIWSRNGGNASGITAGAGVSGGSLAATSTGGGAGLSALGDGSAPGGQTQAIGNRGAAGGNAGGKTGGASGTRTAPIAADGSWRTLAFLLRGCRLHNGATWRTVSGGTGGGGGACNPGTGTASSGAGGGGGGVNVCHFRYVTGPGIIEANGGAGSNATATGNGAAGGGGGGGGGYAGLATSSPSPSVTVRALGGASGNGSGGGNAGGTANAGNAITVIV